MKFEWIKDHLGKNLYLGLCLIGLVVCVPKIETNYGFFAVIICAALFLIILLFMKDEKVLISSDEWFDKITSSLEDASHAVIYLRDFVHPDYFKEKHRKSLMNLMVIIVRKMVQYPGDFKIIAYYDVSKSRKDPLQWIREELSSKHKINSPEQLIENCFKVIKSQPTANSTTAYLIDKSIMLYNKRKDSNQFEYYTLNIDRTIVPYFFINGFYSYKG
jgi:hypothetical protein